MKTKNLVLALAATTALVACGEKAEEVQEEVVEVVEEVVEEAAEPTLETIDQRLSYVIGTNIAQQLVRDQIEFDEQSFLLALADVNAGAESRLTPPEIQSTIQEMQARIQSNQQQALAAAAEKNKTEGEAYLAENATKEGVTVTETGLQYKVLTAGDGAQPTAEDTVSVHYRGTLIDGTEFDSSYSRGEPATFPVQGVIAGWTEALQLMKVGDKFELTIPSDLAYGPGGTGGDIGPNATLIFEVELLDVVSP